MSLDDGQQDGKPSGLHESGLPGRVPQDSAESAEDRKAAGTYQMQWDCRFCGTKKLLGVTHRHCPNCGAAQDPAWRYFPAEDEMIALDDHEYVGADKICPACQQPNSAASTYCSECGADLATGAAAPLQQTRAIGRGVAVEDTQHDVVKEQFDAEMVRAGVTSKGGGKFLGLPGRTWAIIGVIVAVLACVGLIYAVTYSKDVSGEVEQITWERSIQIEVYQQLADETWEDQMPAGAYDLSCSQKKSGEEQVEVGSHQECKDVDQGDGSFKRVCEDVPDYETRPVYDSYCRYKVDVWAPARVEEVSGEGRSPAPYWPEVALAAGAGQYGQEREGAQQEHYMVVIKTSDGDKETCRFDEEAEWNQFKVGDSVEFEANIAGNPDCDTLKVGQ